MGGNALKEYGATRVDKGTFQRISCHIKNLLEMYCTKIDVVQAYTDKETFGDIDILFSSSYTNDFILNIIERYFDVRGVYKSGGVFGFGYVLNDTEIVQVDMIRSKLSHYDYNLNYLNWNDLGNLIGRIAHKFGLKHGHDGLVYVIRDGSHVVGEVTLTTDYAEALKFLGFKPYPNSFKSIKEIHDFVIDSKYFNPAIYLLENRNHIARVRDKKRPTYTSFLEYIQHMQADQASYYQFSDNKGDYVGKIFDAFPDKRAEYDFFVDLAENRKIVKEKFNGQIVTQVTGLTGVELGEFMKHLKQNQPFNDLQLVLSMTDSEIIETINRKYVDDGYQQM